MNKGANNSVWHLTWQDTVNMLDMLNMFNRDFPNGLSHSSIYHVYRTEFNDLTCRLVLLEMDQQLRGKTEIAKLETTAL